MLQNFHWRPTGLKSVGARIYKISGRGRKSGTFICIISGRGRKTVGASAPTAPIRWAPLIIFIYDIILTIVNFPTLQGSRACKKLEERLNLNDARKSRLKLEQCGGIHGIASDSQISGGREKVNRIGVKQVSPHVTIY